MTLTNGTCYFMNFTKACDYYRDQQDDEITPAELEKLVREKIEDAEIQIGAPAIKPGQTLSIIDNGTRYAVTGPI